MIATGPNRIDESSNDRNLLTLSNKKRYYYKGEGNANVILAMFDNDEGMIMRVMKCNTEDDIDDRTKKSQILGAQLDFCRLFRQLYFEDYVDVPLLTNVTTEELCELDIRLMYIRPHNRLHKKLWWAGGLVTVCTDYTLLPKAVAKIGPVYCVEIKPKQGWMLAQDRAAASNFGLSSKCAFCSQQFVKVLKTKEFSRYCPLDLFSGDRKRVERAIQQLLQTPQNNLKMFRDGMSVEWSDCTTLFGGRRSWLARFISAALLGDFNKVNGIKELPLPLDGDDVSDESESPAYPKNRVCNFSAYPMPSHCVLHSILTMQKAQTASFSNVCATYERFSKRMHDDQFGHVRRLLSSTRDLRTEPVDSYLVASTARDCSLFVTFCQTVAEDKCATVVFDGRNYAVRIKVADMDPKPLATIQKHRNRNVDILQTCYSFFERPVIKCKKCKLIILDCACDNMFSPVNVMQEK